MTYERVLLQTIKFDLQVDHPYQNLLKFGKALKGQEVCKARHLYWNMIFYCTTFGNSDKSSTCDTILFPEPANFLRHMLDKNKGSGKDQFLGDPDWLSEMQYNAIRLLFAD